MMGLKEYFTVPEPPEEEHEPFDWKWMCMPRLPWSKESAPPPFYKLHHKVSWPVAIVMGFQHSLVITSGVVLAPILIAGPARFTDAEREYLISACLIASGLFSVVQIKQFRFGNSGYFLGTGLISLLATAIQFVSIGQIAINSMMTEDSTLSCASDFDCTNTWADASGEAIPGVTNLGQCNLESGKCLKSGQEAYGAYLGTLMVGALIQVGMSFMPRKYLHRCFPPMVTGVCVLLIGIGVTGIGIRQWGGGDLCGKHAHKRFQTTVGPDMMGDFGGDRYPSKSPCAGGHCVPFQGALSGVCEYFPAKYDAARNVTVGDRTVCEAFNDMPGVFPAHVAASDSAVKCTENGEVVLPYGSPEYVGLGFAVFACLVFIEMCGSPFLRNCGVIVALSFGFAISCFATYSPPGSDEHLRYVTDDRIKKAPAITFIWAHTFPLGFYAPALLPVLISYVVAAVDTIGDIKFSAAASGVPTEGPEFDARVQGGLLADGLASLLAPLTTTTPNTTISMNNSVISLTRCANKRAGYACAAWLVLYGVLAKVAAILVSIPICVMGGMTTFIFVNIACSVLKSLGDEVESRRNRFIVASALGFGIGVALSPAWIANALIPRDVGPSELARLTRDSVVIILNTPYAIGTLVAMLLHAIIPEESHAPEPHACMLPSPSNPAVSHGSKALTAANGVEASLPPAQLMFPAVTSSLAPPHGHFHTVEPSLNSGSVDSRSAENSTGAASSAASESEGVIRDKGKSEPPTPTRASLVMRKKSSILENTPSGSPKGFRKV